jgi:glucan phosphoethanolaminetransferase (alkaline phosphatase superfamily)
VASEERLPGWRPPRSKGRKDWHVATSEDVEDALDSAERMLRMAAESRRHEQNIRLTLYSFMILTCVAIATVLLAILESRTLYVEYGLPIAVIGTLVTLGATVRLWTLGTGFRSAANHRLQLEMANDLAAQVEEVYLEVARRENWSYLRLTVTKARLSAFQLNQRGQPAQQRSARDPRNPGKVTE